MLNIPSTLPDLRPRQTGTQHRAATDPAAAAPAAEAAPDGSGLFVPVLLLAPTSSGSGPTFIITVQGPSAPQVRCAVLRCLLSVCCTAPCSARCAVLRCVAAAWRWCQLPRLQLALPLPSPLTCQAPHCLARVSPSLQDAQRAAKAAGPGYEPLALMVPLKASAAAVIVA